MVVHQHTANAYSIEKKYNFLIAASRWGLKSGAVDRVSM
jgi:hypothetical protein